MAAARKVTQIIHHLSMLEAPGSDRQAVSFRPQGEISACHESAGLQGGKTSLCHIHQNPPTLNTAELCCHYKRSEIITNRLPRRLTPRNDLVDTQSLTPPATAEDGGNEKILLISKDAGGAASAKLA